MGDFIAWRYCITNHEVAGEPTSRFSKDHVSGSAPGERSDLDLRLALMPAGGLLDIGVGGAAEGAATPSSLRLSRIVAVLKTGSGGNLARGFESLPRRSLRRMQRG